MPTALDILLDKLHAEPEQPTIKSFVIASGLSQRAFAEALGIPLRTIENWCSGARKCPDYVVNLVEYKLKGEGII